MPASHPRAHAAVARAILTGELVRPEVCSKCGQPPNGKGKIHAHHCDYEKPLEVEWLCPRCHRYAEPGVNGIPAGFVQVRLSDDLAARIDAARPSTVSREAWVRGALEAVLSEARQGTPDAPLPAKGADGVTSARVAVIPAAQPRAHGKAKPDLMQALKASLDATRPPDPTLRSNGHLLTCKCWRCEKLDGAA